MNTNKLADEAEMWGRDLLALNMKGGVPVIECARMLRQLQAENEMLRKRFGEELDAHHSALRKLSKLRKVQKK